MGKKFISIFHNNVKTSLNNSIFDIEKNKLDIQTNMMNEVPIFARLRKHAQQKNIILNTYDIITAEPVYRNIHYDLPYPFPSNFHIWKQILSNKKSNVLICQEPPTVNPFNYMKILHKFFIKIYTWNDDAIDNKKYFKIRLVMSSLGINTHAKKFKDKKFLALINTNKAPFYPFTLLSSFGKELYSERINAIGYFEALIPEKFFLYGRGWNKQKKYNLKEKIFGFKKYTTYKGEVIDKIELLSNFKYCLCFENMTNVNGYITEKIFDCFKAKCVPIYWGASNIEKYIPKNCFIDFRDFKDYKDLLIYLDSIDEKKYNNYIDNIKKLLANKEFIDMWFEDRFTNFFLENVLAINEK